jgi:hypothetical protein
MCCKGSLGIEQRVKESKHSSSERLAAAARKLMKLDLVTDFFAKGP